MNVLTTPRETAAGDEQSAIGAERRRARRPSRVALILAGVASVVTVAVGLTIDGGTDAPATAEREVTPFVTIVPSASGGDSSPDR